MEPNTYANSDLSQLGEGGILDRPPKDTLADKPLPLRALLTRPVVISIANSAVISLLEIAARTLISLVWSTPVEFGGLSMSPAAIGLWIGAFGFMCGIFQFVAVPRLVRRFGPRHVSIICTTLFFPTYILFSFEILALRHSSHGQNLVLWLLISLQLSAISFAQMGFGMSPDTFYCAWSLRW